MTSIEWLINKLGISSQITHKKLFEEAKEMHKQEIIDAYNEGELSVVKNAEQYYQETSVSKGSDFKQFSLYEHKDTITSADTQVSKTFLENVRQQETLYTEEQAIEFAKWLAENWFPMWVKDKFVWEHDWDKTCEEQKYQGYYNEKELFELFISLKLPKKD